jgi:CDP-glucose 4,6-dehydratase
MNPKFWVDKKVLITGHTGFKGSWLSLWLQSLGANLTGLALEPPTTPNMFELTNISEGMRSYVADIRDFNAVEKVVSEARPEIVIHMAAQPLVRYSYQNPIETYATNVMGAVHLFEALRKKGGAKAVVNVTSDKCYENKEWVWGYREEEPMGGFDPYSNSKGCAELVTSAYRRSFFQEKGIGLASARAGNVVGGGDWAQDRLIPDILKSFQDRKPVVIRSPDATRPWQHVLEPLSGYLNLAEALWNDQSNFAEAWNFGPKEEDAKPVSWIVDHMVDLWGEGASWILEHEQQPHEAHFLKLDTSKSRGALSWAPRWGIHEALDKTIAWHKAWLSCENLMEFSNQQINEYSASIST